jgi:hypothetical protein
VTPLSCSFLKCMYCKINLYIYILHIIVLYVAESLEIKDFHFVLWKWNDTA